MTPRKNRAAYGAKDESKIDEKTKTNYAGEKHSSVEREKADSLQCKIKRLKEKQKMQKTTEEGKTPSSVDSRLKRSGTTK